MSILKLPVDSFTFITVPANTFLCSAHSLLPRPGGRYEVLFSPCLSVCVCVCLCVCQANILAFYLSAITRDIDMKFIQDTYNRAVLGSLKRSRSQGRYIAF